MSKRNNRPRKKIINLDDPDLVLEFKDDDLKTEFLEELKREEQMVKKKAVRSTKNIIKQVLDDSDELKVENVSKRDTDKIKNLIDYDGQNILMVIDNDKKPWCRAKDVTDILGYSNSREALRKHVSKNHKKSYADIGVTICDIYKIDPQTNFISRTGILQLVSRSKMPKAIEFFDWIADEVIPELLEYGTYTIKSSKSEIDKLTEDYYVENDITDYIDMHVVYLAYVGIFNGVHVLKFGVSGNYPRRELKEHRETYKTYNVLKIWPTIANYVVEEKIKLEMRGKKVLVNEKINGKNKTELIALNGIFTLDKCIKTIDKIVSKTKSVYELENEKIINDLRIENQKLLDKQEFLNQKIMILEKK
jgi:prophage antirepressor-like protein